MATEPDTAQLQEISRRFPGRWLRGYIRGKLGSDPAYAAVAAEIHARPAPVLDLGCGIGLLAHYLDAAGCGAAYLGLDLDAHRIRIAQAAALGLPDCRFEHAPCESPPVWQGHVVILDTLHYLDRERQQALLPAAADRVAPGAALIIRSVLRDASWRFRATRLEEAFMRGVRWMRYPVRHYPEAGELRMPLENAGLHVTLAPLWGRTPFNSYLLIARRSSS